MTVRLIPAIAGRIVWPVLCGVMLAGCAGLREAHDSRVCWQGPWPAIWPDQCDAAALEFRCDRKTVVREASRNATGSIAIRLARAAHPPEVGELFSQFCPPRCIPILVEGATPSQVLIEDARAILRRAGYYIAGGAESADAELELRVEVVDVRSDQPGFRDTKIATRAKVAFSSRLYLRDSEVAWSGYFPAEREIRHSYAALADSAAILSGAYCSALQQFADEIVGDTFRNGLARSVPIALERP